MAAMKERTLQGGPMDGQLWRWEAGYGMDFSHLCPLGNDAYDTSRYDRDGVYVRSSCGDYVGDGTYDYDQIKDRKQAVIDHARARARGEKV